jgi:hypothetical protein
MTSNRAAAASVVGGICLECGRGFTFRPRGRLQVTCDERCRNDRRRRLARVRFQNWLARQIDAAGIRGV